MKVAVVRFPGSNCDQDCVHALRALGADADFLWHKEERLGDMDAVVLPGGFSYGDYLRCGAIARFSPVMRAVRAFAGEGGTVLGICNGFQILCEAGLLPGALVRNRDLHFVCEFVRLRVENAATPFTARCAPGQVLSIPIAHGEGNYRADEATLRDLEAHGQVLFRYCDAAGRVTEAVNPNGSAGNIAGVCNRAGNVFGLMPHPERAIEPQLGGADGILLLGSLLDAVAARA
jgi:phosphoribosylformylglycinamidine synthase I